jgi:hypothetical protein
MVVNPVDNDANPAPVTLVYEVFEFFCGSVAGLSSEEVAGVVAPTVVARVLFEGHEFDRVDAEIG